MTTDFTRKGFLGFGGAFLATGGLNAGTAAALALDVTQGDTGSVPYAELRRRLEKQNHYFAG